MAVRETDLHDPDKVVPEYEEVKPGGPSGPDKAVYCCKCVEANFCEQESYLGTADALLYGYFGQYFT
jgi:hypothetical protein